MKDKELRGVLIKLGLIGGPHGGKGFIYGFEIIAHLQKKLMSAREEIDLILKHLELEAVFSPKETKLRKVKKQLKTSS